jgi:NAD(P)-dependent dehydrogenase (short-subunit alcohol dehydrogenase family)
MGRPDEVAKMALFLATDDSSYSTGSESIIGGWLVTLAMG